MIAKKHARVRIPTLPITCQVPYHIGLELQAHAEVMGITRHRLFFLAFQAGLSLIVEQDSAQPNDQQQG